MIHNMDKNQCRNARQMKKEGILIPQKEHNNTVILDCEDRETNKMPERDFRRLTVPKY